MLLSLEDFRFSLWSIRQRPIVAFFSLESSRNTPLCGNSSWVDPIFGFGSTDKWPNLYLQTASCLRREKTKKKFSSRSFVLGYTKCTRYILCPNTRSTSQGDFEACSRLMLTARVTWSRQPFGHISASSWRGSNAPFMDKNQSQKQVKSNSEYVDTGRASVYLAIAIPRKVRSGDGRGQEEELVSRVHHIQCTYLQMAQKAYT